MENILHEIGLATSKRIAGLKHREPLEAFRRKALAKAYQAQDFSSAFSGEGYNIIAEYKRASPSQGDIAPELGVLDVVSAYLENDAQAISILTEPEYFKGDVDFIAAVRSAYPQAKILMKDFFVDEYQLYQALYYGADCILLIVGLLDGRQLKRLYQQALDLGLSVLVEVHNEKELQQALPLENAIIGINNRDLTNLSIDLKTTQSLLPKVPEHRITISESGIKTHHDLQTLSDCGVKGFLVGTSLMATKMPGKALAKLLGKSC